ncbi:MMPL family transporter [Gordonia sp. TBRC 11910]|uniref:MMPL family transporter n=1 Tax=Gordonia asplenii TaxID=2725283 RepID=A0A848KTQ8_9ACTN|nr:MMPL family transporter [Gordonia asplenii]NMO02314.1 MMPL family transporter [Gordonia asplenii]
MIVRLTRLVISAPRIALLGGLIFVIVAGGYGAGAAKGLLAGGYSDPNSPSEHANTLLDQQFGRGGLQVVLKLDAAAGVDMATDPTARRVGNQIIDELQTLPYVQKPIVSLWHEPGAAASLQSRDRNSALIFVTLSGGESKAPAYADDIAKQFTGKRDGIAVSVGGQAAVYSQVNQQTSHDLLVAEGIAVPISFLLLIAVFGGLVAAGLPIAVGVVSIVCTFALLRALSEFTDVSVFALNLTTALGLALAIDYTLLIISRYREEVAAGRDRPDAIVTAMANAGRTVLFSAITVGLALAALVLFPMYFLKSFAYAGIGVVVVALVAALVLTPAMLMVLGDRVDALDLRRPIRRALGMGAPAIIPVERTRWYRSVQFVLRHAAPIAVVVVAVLLVLGAPFVSMRFGFPDDRVLPPTASARSIQDDIRRDFAESMSSPVTIVVRGASAADLSTYAADLSKVDGVASVSIPDGRFMNGRRIAPGEPDDARGEYSIVTVSTKYGPTSEAGTTQLKHLHDVHSPGEAMFTGLAQTNVDSVGAIYRTLPWVLLWIGVATFILLFLFTGSVVLPLKALVLNVLSLTATFGAMVFFFQEGHWGGLGTEATGYLVATMPVLMFCVAFGLSMDYEVFLLGRIRESWLESGRTREDSDHAVAFGLASTGRVITAAAFLMSIVFAGMIASQVSFMRMFGVGLTVAVLMDATLIRMLLVPAFMKLAGRANWWAPGPLRRLHDRIGLSEEATTRDSTSPNALTARVGRTTAR